MARRTRRQVKPFAFWDASFLVPLCVLQSLTSKALAQHAAFDIVVWWSTPVEIAGAFARLLRMGQLDVPAARNARQMADTLAASWSVVQPSDAVLQKAVQFVDRFELRAADSLQLAAAWQWCEGLPAGKIFLTADRKLREAAALAGFELQ